MVHLGAEPGNGELVQLFHCPLCLVRRGNASPNPRPFLERELLPGWLPEMEKGEAVENPGLPCTKCFSSVTSEKAKIPKTGD